mmetsp:Transcript_108326/g.187120  ORF Transcript_108326/g.187120 Transcript_108326/m.187120 type:complete len:96 (-) Transcript_108326:13-300(-)
MVRANACAATLPQGGKVSDVACELQVSATETNADTCQWEIRILQWVQSTGGDTFPRPPYLPLSLPMAHIPAPPLPPPGGGWEMAPTAPHHKLNSA